MNIFNIFKKKINNSTEEYYEEIDNEESFVEDSRKLYNIEIEDNSYIAELERNSNIIDQISAMVALQNDIKTGEIYSIQNIIRNINKREVGNISKYINDISILSDELKEHFNSAIQCESALNYAILSILYYFYEDGVDELLKISTRGDDLGLNAIKFLCKQAKDKIEEDKIVDSIFYIMEGFNEEYNLEVLESISSIKENKKVEEVLNAYFKSYALKGDSVNSYNIILNLINNKNKYSKQHLNFLKAIAFKEKTINLSDVLTGEVGTIEFHSISEELSVKAAISFYSLNIYNIEINRRLEEIKETSTDLEVRKYISEILKKEYFQ